VEAGHAVLSIYANDPDLLKDQTPELVTAIQHTTATSVRPFRELISRNQTNWAVVRGIGGENGRQRCFRQCPPIAKSTSYGAPSRACAVSINRIRLPPGKRTWKRWPCARRI